MAHLFDNRLISVLGSDGAPIPGAKLSWRVAGTSTAIDTYSDSDLTAENTNPVIADANGRFGSIYLAAGEYKFILTDANDVPILTQDDYAVTADPIDTAAALDAFLAGSVPLPVASGGTGSSTAVNALAALGAFPAAGGTVAGAVIRSGGGAHLYNATAAMANGGVFLTAAGAADPTSLPGQWWAKYA